MAVGRMLAAAAAAAAVAGCAVVAVGMSRASTVPTASDDTPTPLPTASERSYRVVAPVPLTSSNPPTVAPPVTATAPRTAQPRTKARTTPAAPATSTHPPTSRPPAAPRHTSSTPKPSHRAALRRGVALPLHFGTGSATRVITVTASNWSTTTARLQRWHKAPGGGWLKTGASTLAHIGEQGVTNAMSEFVSATPVGSFTLTQAFGRLSNPGTPLPYFKTSRADWWISQSGPKYNTHQRCTNYSTNCGFKPPSEHLYYETPYYNYAVVIDYNTRNAGKVVQNGGSAVFLHVTDGNPTAGCVAISRSRLVTVMRWLAPSTHPRILIGVA